MSESVKIKIVEHELFLNFNDNPIFLPFAVVPNSLSGLAYKDNIITCRMRFKGNISNCSSEVRLSDCSFFDPIRKLQVGDQISLSCFQCGLAMLKNNISIRYISFDTAEIFEASDMFCHRSKNALSFEQDLSAKSPEGVAVRYENGYYTISPFNANDLQWPSKTVIHCVRCFSWLGVLKQNENTAQFWLDTVKLSDFYHDVEQSKISTEIFFSIIEKAIGSCLFPICNVMLICKVMDNEENRLLLTVMDRNVLIYELEDMANPSKFRESIFVKILFKHLQENDADDNTNIHGLFYVSKSIFCAALRILHTAKEIPYFDAEEEIAYLKIH